MKHIFAISFLFSALSIAQGQIVPNGDLEQWDTTYTLAPYPIPLNWIFSQVVNPNCPVFPDLTMELSHESNSGCCAVKLTTHPCRLGFIFSAGSCMARPAQLNFHYIFQPQGGDSAYVYILLFNFDEGTSSFDTVGFASGYMHDEVTSFTQFSLPIQYFSEAIPASMRIFFSTSKTQSEFFSIGIGGPTASFATAGTSLSLDDVYLSGTTGMVEQFPQESISVFPNPSAERIWFKGMDLTGEVYVTVFDAKGAQVLGKRMFDPAQGVDVRQLRPGPYSIVIMESGGTSLRTTWVKE